MILMFDFFRMNASDGAPPSSLFATNCAHSSTQQLLRFCIKSQPGRLFIFPKQEQNSVQITNISEILILISFIWGGKKQLLAKINKFKSPATGPSS